MRDRESSDRARGTGRSRRLTVILALLFAFAVFMATGPGLLLVNPDAEDPNAKRMWAGVPIIYAWGIAWFAVMISVLASFYFLRWRHAADDADGRGRGIPE